jgi:four helix bundle protein
MASGKDRGVPFDIRKRTFLFAVRVVQFVGKLPRATAALEIARQLVRAGSSVGCNVEEADGALSRKDFVNQLRIARKEARETRFWFRLIESANLLRDPELPALIQEADELVRILRKIASAASARQSPTPTSRSH